MSDARTRWARVTFARFDRIGRFVGVIGAFRDEPAQADDATVPASAMNDVLLAEKWEKESWSDPGAPLELVLLCRHRRQSASFCSLFVPKSGETSREA